MGALFDRSLAIARAEFPWLPVVDAPSLEARWKELGTSLEAQAPETGLEAAVAVVTELVALIGRLIGDELTLRLLQEVWAAGAPDKSKETT